jgi:hypothetical protein
VIRVYLEGIGVFGPGLDGWAASQPILAGAQDYVSAETRVPAADLLPANERRRAVQTVKIALAVSAEAFTAAARDPAQTATIFASSGGDGDTIHEILHVLSLPAREISPTRFHNSVHNAPAGYWSIATGARTASSSLCCHDDSFAAGWLEAAVQTVTDHCAVALIAYDVRYPDPLNQVRPIGASFAVACVLNPEPTARSFATVEMRLVPKSAVSVMAAPALESLRQNTPAARSLPLLAALASSAQSEIILNYLDDMAMVFTITSVPAGKPPC